MAIKNIGIILKTTSAIFTFGIVLAVVVLVLLPPRQNDKPVSETPSSSSETPANNVNKAAAFQSDYASLIPEDKPEVDRSDFFLLTKINDKFKLLGTICTKDNPEGNYAVIQPLEPNEKQVLKKAGELIDEYLIKSIEPDKMVILAEGKEVCLEVGKFAYYAYTLGDIYAPITEEDLAFLSFCDEKIKEYVAAQPEARAIVNRLLWWGRVWPGSRAGIEESYNKPEWDDFFSTYNIDKGKFITLNYKFALATTLSSYISDLDLSELPREQRFLQSNDYYMKKYEELTAKGTRILEFDFNDFKKLLEKMPHENLEIYQKLKNEKEEKSRRKKKVKHYISYQEDFITDLEGMGITDEVVGIMKRNLTLYREVADRIPPFKKYYFQNWKKTGEDYFKQQEEFLADLEKIEGTEEIIKEIRENLETLKKLKDYYPPEI